MLKATAFFMFMFFFSTNNEDIIKDWAEIKNVATEVLSEFSSTLARTRVPLAGNLVFQSLP